jgi:thioredoxin-like negative regulator of GroEL
LPADMPELKWSEAQVQYHNTIDQLYNILYTVPKENLLSQMVADPENADLKRRLAILYVKFEEYQAAIDLLSQIYNDNDKDYLDNYYIGIC